MTVRSHKLGPGVLTLGTGPLAVQQQLTAFKLVPTETVDGGDDAVNVLSGEQLAAEPGTPSFTWTAQGTFLQDLLAAGVVAWSWANAGASMDFHFEPDGSGAEFDGSLFPVPLQVGGDEVTKRMTADFTWRLDGDPTPTWAS